MSEMNPIASGSSVPTVAVPARAVAAAANAAVAPRQNPLLVMSMATSLKTHFTHTEMRRALYCPAFAENVQSGLSVDAEPIPTSHATFTLLK